MKLNYESKDQLPEDIADNFVEFKEGDSIVYLHKDLADQRREYYRLKGDYTELNRKYGEQNEKVQKILEQEQERQRQKEQQEEQERLKGGQHQEIIDDLKKRLSEKDLEWQDKYNALMSEVRNKEKRALISELASAATEKTRKELSRLIALDLSFDENGGIIIIDDEGKATSTTLDEYRASLKTRYPALVAEVQSSGGTGQGATGGTGGQKKPEDYTEQERIALFRQNPVMFKQIFNI